MKKNTVLFAIDSGYVAHLSACLYSLLKNNMHRTFNIVVITSNIAKSDCSNLCQIANSFRSNLKIEFLRESVFDGLKVNYHFQKSNYYRLFAADFIADDKCLYLDADIIVTSPIDELLDIELGDYFLAAVENPGFDRHHELGMRISSKYFNSGVMLLNLDKWRDLNVKESVINFVKKNSEVICFVDQCGLNAVVDGDWIKLDAMYNVQTSMLDKQMFSNDFVRKNCKIIHYTGSSKPWLLNNKHPFKKNYWLNRNKTPYKSFLADDFSFVNFLKLLTPCFVKSAFKNLIKKT